MSSERFGRGAKQDNGDGMVTTRSRTDARKQSLYFTGNTLQEIKEQAARLDRTLSWVVQRAWKIARTEIAALPTMGDTETDEVDADGVGPTGELDNTDV